MVYTKGEYAGEENTEYTMIKNLEKSQDLQNLRSTYLERDERSVFIESKNQYVMSMNFNEETLELYTKQILKAFPQAKAKVDKILKLENPIEHSKE